MLKKKTIEKKAASCSCGLSCLCFPFMIWDWPSLRIRNQWSDWQWPRQEDVEKSSEWGLKTTAKQTPARESPWPTEDTWARLRDAEQSGWCPAEWMKRGNRWNNTISDRLRGGLFASDINMMCSRPCWSDSSWACGHTPLERIREKIEKGTRNTIRVVIRAIKHTCTLSVYTVESDEKTPSHSLVQTRWSLVLRLEIELLYPCIVIDFHTHKCTHIRSHTLS